MRQAVSVQCRIEFVVRNQWWNLERCPVWKLACRLSDPVVDRVGALNEFFARSEDLLGLSQGHPQIQRLQDVA